MSVVICALSLLSINARQPQPEPFFAGLGNHHRAVTTKSNTAQKYFDQGLNFLFAFNHDEAIRSFQAATQADPKCAMAWWGIAIANGPHINNPMVDEVHANKAWDALSNAKSLATGCTKAEKSLIQAAGSRYAMPQPADRSGLDLAYANAMRKVWKSFPKDPDIGSMFAEAMMDLRPWDLWKPDTTPQPGTMEIVTTLRKVLAIDKMHPLGNHLYIHAVEASPHPEWGDAAADRLRNLEPGLGHVVHMPSHIDVRTGRWQAAIKANQKAIVTDDNYRAKSPNQGFYHIYMAHNHHMLAYAAMMNGQSKIAVGAVDKMIQGMPMEMIKAIAPLVDGFLSMPIEVRKRFGKWDEVLEMPEIDGIFPISRTLRHEARAVAHAAKGMPEEARAEQAAFYDAKKKVPASATFGNNTAKDLLIVAEHLMNGEILIAEKKIEPALAEIRMGVAAEDRLRYDEPADWIQPIRHTLGAALLSASKFDEAERVYRADLKKLPYNGWSMYGLAKALDGQGRSAESKRIMATFTKIWALADIKIDSSCLCIPGN